MIRTRRTVGLIAALLSCVLFATACSDSGERGATVSLLVSGSPEELAAFRTLADAYQKDNPGSRIQLIEASDAEDLITRLSTSSRVAHRPTSS